MLKFEGNENIWVTSDPHFNHNNICRGVTNWRTETGEIPISSTRDFQNLDDMNTRIVENINSVVGQDDILLCLGDWSFGGFESIKQFRDRIVCNNIHLILGNHDHHIKINKKGIQEIFKSVSKYDLMTYGKHNFVLFHYPISSWDGLKKGHIHLHGHVHSSTERRFTNGKKMDVGIDGHPEFRPYNLKHEIIPMMDKREIGSETPYDHHMDKIVGVVG